jgi:hypothetical protein
MRQDNGIPAELAAIHAQYRLFMITLRHGAVGPWKPEGPWTEVRGMVVRARDAEHARLVAADMARYYNTGHESLWLDENIFMVEPLDQAGVPGVLIANYE